MLSAVLFVCAKLCRFLGNFISFLVDQDQRRKVDDRLTRLYVEIDDFHWDDLVRRAAESYAGYLKLATGNNSRRVARLGRTFLVGCAIGFSWAMLTWIQLSDSIAAIPTFFTWGKLNAILLVGGFWIAVMFVVDVWLVGLLVNAVRAKTPFIGRPLVAITASLILAIASWSFVSGLFAATALLGALLREGDFNSFMIGIGWIFQRWTVAVSHGINGAAELKLQSTGRFVTSSAFGIPAMIASLFFAFTVMATWLVEAHERRILRPAANTVAMLDSLWRKITRRLPSFDARRVGRIGWAICMALAILAALL